MRGGRLWGTDRAHAGRKKRLMVAHGRRINTGREEDDDDAIRVILRHARGLIGADESSGGDY